MGQVKGYVSSDEEESDSDDESFHPPYLCANRGAANVGIPRAISSLITMFRVPEVCAEAATRTRQYDGRSNCSCVSIVEP